MPVAVGHPVTRDDVLVYCVGDDGVVPAGDKAQGAASPADDPECAKGGPSCKELEGSVTEKDSDGEGSVTEKDSEDEGSVTEKDSEDEGSVTEKDSEDEDASMRNNKLTIDMWQTHKPRARPCVNIRIVDSTQNGRVNRIKCQRSQLCSRIPCPAVTRAIGEYVGTRIEVRLGTIGGEVPASVSDVYYGYVQASIPTMEHLGLDMFCSPTQKYVSDVFMYTACMHDTCDHPRMLEMSSREAFVVTFEYTAMACKRRRLK
jgi:hypothetical protein